MRALEDQPNVVMVWTDAPIAPFPAPPMGPCPIPPCDCDPSTAKGTTADVAQYLGVNQIRAAGYRGKGIVVGVVDGGIAAKNRPVLPAEIPFTFTDRVIDGYPADWGTTSADWGGHGNMTSFDVLAMAPEAQIYDIRISDGPLPS